MSHENIEIVYDNFCIGAMVDTFHTVDITNYPTCIMQIKSSTGQNQGNYTLDTSVDSSGVKSLEYPGPRDTFAVADGLPFFTLERISDSQCKIRKWKFNDTLNTLVLDQTITKSNVGSYCFNCYDMTVEYYQTEFDTTTVTGTGQIKVDAVGDIETGDVLYLGLSSNISYMGDFEEVEVTSVSGTYVNIITTVSGGSTPPVFVYNTTDVVSYCKHIYLFSDTGQNGDTTKGSFYKLNMDGTVSDVVDSGIFSGVRASSWGLPYSNTVGFVKNTNLHYMDVDDYSLIKSMALTNIKANEDTVIDVHDVAFKYSVSYRLQDSITRRNDNGTKTDYSWSTYNYQLDGVAQYTDSITMWADPAVLGNQESTIIYALVRNQYGGVLPSKTVHFAKTGDPTGDFDDPNEQADTNASGIAQIGYTSGWYDPGIADNCCDDIYITGYTDGSNSYTGSQYVWDAVELTLYKKFIGDLVYLVQKETTSGTWPTEGSNLYSQSYLEQLEIFESYLYIFGLSNIQFPGGHWTEVGAPSDNTTLISQLDEFESEVLMTQLSFEFENEIPIYQWKEKTNQGKLDQTYISRHTLTGHIDTAEISQFRFIIEARPAFWSEKNTRDTDIWIKLAPYGFSLNQTTLSFQVREISYGGDTGWTEYAGTSYINVSTWDAGGGLLGLEINVNPPNNFHHNGVVYVSIEVYDTAVIPNIIKAEYWFKIVADYKAPYVINEIPARETMGVKVDTNIEFDLIDPGVGVNFDTLEVFINNRQKSFTPTTISGGYHLFYNPPQNFCFGETVEVSIKVEDFSDNENVLYDMWRFYVVESDGPWFDPESFDPQNCSLGVYRKYNPISFNVYEINDTGIDKASILVYIGGRERNVTLTPIIYRLN